jgi:uncharacterized protein YdhG (YjbR/CyaY superfamily)
MPATAKNKVTVTAKPGKQDLFITREFDAPRELVDPDLYVQWVGPHGKEDAEKAVFEAIAKMKEPDRFMAKRIHDLIKAAAPALMPKTWYGMPAYADKDGKVICFFQAASKFGVRYATFGFQPDAKLDEGNMWAAGFALIKLTAAEEKKIIALVKKAVK